MARGAASSNRRSQIPVRSLKLSPQQRLRRKALRALQKFSPRAFDWWSDRDHLRRYGATTAPWAWQPGPRCPERRIDAAGAQVGARLFVFGGFRTLDDLVPFVDVLDLERGAWTERFAMPPAMAHTHHGVATDGRRYAFFVAGQFGPQCSPAVARCFALDAMTREWSELPPLPDVRYAPTATLREQRLHVIGGGHADRHSPAVDHWSIAVDAGRATEATWRREPPIPRGGSHRASVVFDRAIYVFGGQEGDVMPARGDARFTCDFATPPDRVHAEVYRLGFGATSWERMADLPVPSSHIDFCALPVDGRLFLFGGTRDRFVVNDEVQCYDFARNTWTIAGRLPYGVKNGIAARCGRRVFIATGQRSRSVDDPAPGLVLNSVWTAPMPEVCP